MKKLIITALMILWAGSAQAHGHHHYHHHRYHSFIGGLGHGLIHMMHSIERIETKAGPIVVASNYADKFKGLIADFVDAGYHPRAIGCFARGGHVANSRHYLGEACDFDQTGWGKTTRFMYTHEAAAIIHKWGFTNGCSFRDCGHVGTDGQRSERWARR